MKKLHLISGIIMITLFLLSSCKNTKEESSETTTQNNEIVAEKSIQVIQFHSEHRCMTCNKIEALTMEALKKHPEIVFSLVNVDDKVNAAKAEEFEATGTALFLYNPATGKKKELTDFAFMTAGDEAKFDEELQKEIDLFLKS